MNPFAILGVEDRFGLDAKELEQRHRELARALHPDRHASEPRSQRMLALSRAIEVNEAYRVLKDPIRRAEKLLALRGVPVGETKEPPPSEELLMDMMDQREALSDAMRTKNHVAVERLAKPMRQRELNLVATLAAALDAPDGTESAKALCALAELRYTKRFLEEVAAFEEAALG